MRKYTVIFIVSIISLIAIYDAWIINVSGKQDSISWVIITWSHKYPLFVFLIGIAMGHLFWRMQNPNDPNDKVS